MRNCNCIIKILAFVAVLSLCDSCKKDTLLVTNNPALTFDDIFETFWNKMNQNYVYWDTDSTDWDKIYLIYKPKFANLSLGNDSDAIKSVQYFTEMTKGLRDSHYQINFLNSAIAHSFINPAFNKKQLSAQFHYPYPYYKVDTAYLDKGFQLGLDYGNISNNLPFAVLSGTIDKRILYFSCNQFALVKYYQANTNSIIQRILKDLVSQLNNLPDYIKGVIIDVRSNQGGDVADLNFLFGQFINKRLHFGYTQSKSGNGRLDFTPWIEAYIYPQANAKNLAIPIITLTDNVSASLSEAFAMATHLLPNGIVVGERTWGATGPLIKQDVFNAGAFTIPGFLAVQSSSVKFKYLDGKSYEGVGFSPDYPIPFSLQLLNQHKDIQLEKAINLIGP
ncbi:MAG: peptidase S41 [Chitinophagaceae bacterium]|nr:MAG: peptidase S41 [Chitinophagaceae bacterium]